MTASLWIGLYLQVDGLTAHRTALAGLYFAGGALAFPIALFAARFAGLKRSAEIRFAASLVALAGTTLGLTSGMYVLIFWNFHAQSHGEFLTPAWLVHFAYAGTGALYQFAVIGTRLYLPLGIVVLLASSVWMARRIR